MRRRYHAEPSGTFYRYDAKAIGSGSEGAQAELQNEYHKVYTALMVSLLFGSPANTFVSLVIDARRGRDVSAEDPEAGDGGEAGFQERATGFGDEGEGLQDLSR